MVIESLADMQMPFSSLPEDLKNAAYNAYDAVSPVMENGDRNIIHHS